MGRLNFERILSNLHISDNTIASNDLLVKLKPFIDMCDRNFLHVYKSKKNISVDEASCKWKGHFSHKVYNPRKPSKFHIKLYQVCEADSGYVISFEVYIGKANSPCIQMSNPIDPSVNSTTKLVLGLLEKGQLLDKGYNIFTDNYYTSPELLCELFYRNTFGTGTVRSMRKNMPKAVVGAKLKQGESCFHRNGKLPCIKWCDKCQVTVLTTIDDAIEIAWKRDRQGNVQFKPKTLVDYTNNMRGCDLLDQLMTSYCMLHRSVKWWRKLFFHMFSLLLNNAYVLHKKFGVKPIAHDAFLEHIVQYLLSESLGNATTKVIRKRADERNSCRFEDHHYPVHIAKCAGSKNGSKKCSACNFGKKELSIAGNRIALKRKLTSYQCDVCEIPLCIEPCFKTYHKVTNYRRSLLDFRLTNS